MTNFENLLTGFAELWTPEVLLWCVIGVLIGTLVGALPGLGPTAGIALLLPLSFTLDTLSALLLLMGIYQGAMYGGRISSILVNVPGEAMAVVTAFDGYPMTRQGRAGYALSLSAVASFLGGMIGFVGLVFLMPVMTDVALEFGPPEFFWLMLFALIATGGLGNSTLLKGLITICLGLLIAVVGLDPILGTERLTFGVLELRDGINFVVVAVGAFGLSEVFGLLAERRRAEGDTDVAIPLKELIPRAGQLRNNAGSISRGGVIGFLVGVLPGAGATIATFLSYAVEKKVSTTPRKFGTGVDQGLSGPESANNSSIGGALVPLFTLGIPGSGITAILLGALITVGLEPGPRLLTDSGPIVWATIAGLFVANALLLVLNTAFVPAFTLLIRWARPYLAPLVTALCVIGVYMINQNFFDVGLMIVFGVFGHLLRTVGFPLAPLLLAVVLGQTLESSLRQSLLLSQNNPSIFVTRPVSLVLLILTVAVFAAPLVRRVARRRAATPDSVAAPR